MMTSNRLDPDLWLQATPAERTEAFTLAEDILARNGYAVVSTEIAQLMDKINASPPTATSAECSAVMYAIYAGRFGDYWPCKVFA